MASLVELPQQLRDRRSDRPVSIVNLNLNPFDSDNDSEDEYLIPTTPIEKTDDVDLYYAERECYIYKQKGQSNGKPKSKDSIIYDIFPNEVIAISNKSNARIDEYYVQCMLPIQGYVYLPDMSCDNDHNIEDDAPINNQLIQRSDTLQKRDYTNQKFIKIDEVPDQRNDPQYSEEKPEETKLSKILESKTIKKTILFLRTHPFLPGLIILIIQAVIEVLAIIDIVTDITVMFQLKNSRNPVLFAISAGLIAAPFFIAWTVAGHTILAKYEKAQRKDQNTKVWSTILALYSVAPIGILMVLIFEIFHWIETIVVIPVYWVVTFGRRYRTIGYSEKGYYKLRKVSEVFAESFPQAIFQLCLILGVFGDAACDRCNQASVALSLVVSIIFLCLWCIGLFFESRANGISFGEYVTITFQGSFDFVPYLPAIEKGVEQKGEFVNWANFKIKTESFGQISKSVYSVGCKLKLLKVSQYTIRGLRRMKCKFLGSRFKVLSLKHNLEIIVSRVEPELHDLFDKYDLDKSGSFDFIEFVKIFLSINSMVNERAIMTDIYSIWFKVADKRANVVWMLDLLLKATNATEFMPLIDYKSPLIHAFEKSNINLMTFLISSNYIAANHMEWNICVTRAVMENNLKLACVLCENIGIPIVVSLQNCTRLQFVNQDKAGQKEEDMNPYLMINVLGQEKSTEFRRETNNPNWDENVLFILGFDAINDILETNNIEPYVIQQKSVKHRRNQQYQLVSAEDESKGSIISADEVDDPSSYDLPKYLSVAKDKSIGFTFDHNLQRQPSKFEKEQKEQCLLMIALTAYSKLFADQNKIDYIETELDMKEEIGVRDKYIGKTFVSVDLKEDMSSYHEKIRTFDLNHSLKKRGKLTKCGQVSCNIYLNVLNMYSEALVKTREQNYDYDYLLTPMEMIIDTNIMYRRDV